MILIKGGIEALLAGNMRIPKLGVLSIPASGAPSYPSPPIEVAVKAPIQPLSRVGALPMVEADIDNLPIFEQNFEVVASGAATTHEILAEIMVFQSRQNSGWWPHRRPLLLG
ncbi:hypothetical protein CRG98_032304 [Punica granatum]|uniref:Uncharacterized protein n=1 Tax=Punica granatum TaxID=22663 RepID=A0A2I0ITH4_PUNGR|nr:hypothetical protein CRG98_032304 [Punica granatum]